MVSNFTTEQKNIEIIEYKLLTKLNSIFSESLDEFNTLFLRSLKYMKYIALPILMASLKEKSYNPFAEIIEKYICFIVNKKMISIDYQMLPIAYSSDLTFENENTVINIDIKTANIDNLADYKNLIPLGLNQTSYSPSLVVRIGRSSINGIRGHSYLPTEYIIDDKKKLTLTNGLIFIYPTYKELIREIKDDFVQINDLISFKLKEDLLKCIKNESEVNKFLNFKPEKERFTRSEMIVPNLIRGLFIHGEKTYEFDDTEIKSIEKFVEQISSMAEKFARLEIKPIAIVSVSVPNGKLKPHYDNEIVSGKTYGNSIRFKYDDGKYKSMQDKYRVNFIYIDETHKNSLKRFFKKIIIYQNSQVEIL